MGIYSIAWFVFYLFLALTAFFPAGGPWVGRAYQALVVIEIGLLGFMLLTGNR